MAKVLTQAALDALKHTDKRQEVADQKVAGLHFILQPSPSRSRSWAFRFRILGKSAKATLGSYPSLGLGQARDLARRAAADIANGIDPRAKKKAAKVAANEASRSELDGIERVVDLFIARYARPKNRSWAESERLLKAEIVSQWRGRPLSSIRRRDVVALLDRIIDRGSPVTANRVFSNFRRLCGWCVEREIIEINPCAGLKAPSPERSRDRVLSDEEIRAAWKAFDAVGYPFGDLAKLLLLTGQRLREVAAAPWSEFDLEGKVWRLPKERTKGGVGLEIPLSDAVLAILRSLPRFEARGGQAAFLFTLSGVKPLDDFSKGKLRIDARMLTELRRERGDETVALEHWTMHDLRRSFASGSASLGIAPHIVEAVLGHRGGVVSGIARIYNRFDYAGEKRAALERWAAHVERLASGAEAGNIVELAAARR
jgi:integrase